MLLKKENKCTVFLCLLTLIIHNFVHILWELSWKSHRRNSLFVISFSPSKIRPDVETSQLICIFTLMQIFTERYFRTDYSFLWKIYSVGHFFNMVFRFGIFFHFQSFIVGYYIFQSMFVNDCISKSIDSTMENGFNHFYQELFRKQQPYKSHW